jgi:hypothetical protein
MGELERLRAACPGWVVVRAEQVEDLWRPGFAVLVREGLEPPVWAAWHPARGVAFASSHLPSFAETLLRPVP